jgi:hypothetical protein
VPKCPDKFGVAEWIERVIGESLRGRDGDRFRQLMGRELGKCGEKVSVVGEQRAREGIGQC